MDQRSTTASPGDSLLRYQDTSKVVIHRQGLQIIQYTDSTFNVRVKVKDTANLKKLSLEFQDNMYFSDSKVENQSFSIKVHTNAIGSNPLILYGTYDFLGFTINRYDSLSLWVRSSSALKDFKVNPNSMVLNKQHPFRPTYMGVYDEFVGTLNARID